jgi:hypothetical protein
MKRGQFREVDPRTAALAIVGMCLWVAWWVDDAPLDVLAEQIGDQAVCGVVAPHVDRSSSDPRTLLRQTRGMLDRLALLLERRS